MKNNSRNDAVRPCGVTSLNSCTLDQGASSPARRRWVKPSQRILSLEGGGALLGASILKLTGNLPGYEGCDDDPWSTGGMDGSGNLPGYGGGGDPWSTGSADGGGSLPGYSWGEPPW